MGGGGRYSYPKYVWSPSGGWWSRPSNWVSNTAISFGGILAVTYAVWTITSEKEERYVEPNRPLPSKLWQNSYRGLPN